MGSRRGAGGDFRVWWVWCEEGVVWPFGQFAGLLARYRVDFFFLFSTFLFVSVAFCMALGQLPTRSIAMIPTRRLRSVMNLLL